MVSGLGKLKLYIFLLLLLLVLSSPYNAFSQDKGKQGDFEWEYNFYGMSITGYTGKKTDITIPSIINGKNVTYIDESAFRGKQLTKVVLPNKLLRIGSRAFENNRLTAITFPETLKEIGGQAFLSNQLTVLIIPDNIEEIGTRAFVSNKLTKVVFGTGLKAINDGAFGFNQLTSITIPVNVWFIGEFAFAGNNLTSIVNIGNPFIRVNTFDNFEDIYKDNRMGNKLIEGTYTRPNAQSKNWVKIK